MMNVKDLGLTALAPLIWGSSYIVTTELLAELTPMWLAALRALPAGVLLLVFARHLPKGIWWAKIAILGALNFSIFWSLMFVAAYRLPGGVAAIMGAVQPLLVVFMAAAVLGSAIRAISVVAALFGLVGVALLILSPGAGFDPIGVIAGIGGAISMGLGSVLTKKWQPPESLLTFTAWQLTAGGLLLLPFAVFFEPALPVLTAQNWLGLIWLGLIGAALTYVLWFRGLTRLEPALVAPLGFLSPLAAIVLGWAILGEALSAIQIIGGGVVLGSVLLAQVAGKGGPARPPLFRGFAPDPKLGSPR